MGDAGGGKSELWGKLIAKKRKVGIDVRKLFFFIGKWIYDAVNLGDGTTIL